MNKSPDCPGPKIREAIEAVDAKLLFLPPYGPDFNNIKMAFSKLKALLKAADMQTRDKVWKTVE